MFPVEAHIMAFDPDSTALETAMVIPRSLNEPVGLSPSYFKKIDILGFIFCASRGAGIKGVLPSCIVMTFLSSENLKKSGYSLIMPFHMIYLHQPGFFAGNATFHNKDPKN